MDENLHNIDDLFKKAIDEFETSPSSSVWENIDKSLDKQKVVSISKKYKNLKWAAAALLIFSAGLAMYTWNTRLRNKELVRESSNKTKKIAAENYNQSRKTITPANVALNNKAVKPTELDTFNTNNKKATAFPVKTDSIPNVGKSTFAENSSQDLNKEEQKVAKKQPVTENVNLLEQKNPFNRSKRKEDLATAKRDNKADEAINNTSLSKTAIVDLSTVPALKNNTFDAQAAKAALEKYLQLHPAFAQTKADNSIADNSKKTTANKKSSRLTVGAFYSKDFVSTNIENEAHGFREDDKNEIKNKEKIKNSFTTGLLVNYNAGKNWGLQTGLTFSSLTNNIQPKTIFARPDSRGDIKFRYNCSAGYSFVSVKTTTSPAAGDSMMALSSTNTLQYIGVPFAVNYTFSHKKIDFTPGIGLAGNFLTGGKLETIIQGQPGNGNQKENINHLEGLNSFYLDALIRFNISYNVNRFMNINLTPASTIALTSINKDAPVKTYLNSFGIAAGITLKL